MSFEAQGTIKVKTTDGRLVPFRPETDISCVRDRETGISAAQSLSAINERLATRSGQSAVKVMYEAPTDANTDSFNPKTLIGAIVPATSEKKMQFSAEISSPANHSFFVYGEPFTITYSAFNLSNEDVANASIVQAGRDTIENVELDIAEVKTFIYEGTVDENDVSWCIDADSPKTISSAMNFAGSNAFTFYGDTSVELNCLPSSPSYYDPALNLSFSVTAPNGYDVGSTISYSFQIRNDSNGPLSGPVSYSVLNAYGDEDVSGEADIAVGETQTVNGSLTITENDILNRENWGITGSATAESFLGAERSFSLAKPVSLALPNPKLSVVYRVTNSPQDGKLWTDGETAHYEITVSNAGNLTLSDITVLDQNSDLSTSIASLAPGQSQIISDNSFAFTIPAGNEEGMLSCTATTSATAPASLTPTYQVKQLTLVTDKNSGFQFTVNTTKASSSNVKTAAPFSTTNADTEINIDWGDGTTSTFDSSTTSQLHSYASPGTYSIIVSSTDWTSTTLITTSTTSVTESSNPTLYWFRNTLVSFDGMLPDLANSALTYAFSGCSKLSSIPDAFFINCSAKSSFAYCFRGCTSLTSIPSDLFSYCTSSSSFAYALYGCSGLTSIPDTIFANCTAVTSVHSLFYNCSSLTSLPQNLFADCPGILNFHTICRGCTSLQTIPEDLFKHSPDATDIGGAFWSCRNLASIPEDLLRYNVALTNVGALFCSARGEAFSNFPTNLLKYNVNVTTLTTDSYGFFESSGATSFSLRIGSPKVSNAQYFCYSLSTSGVTRIIYVPAGSTTKTTMSNYATSFALTIVEE